MSQRRQKKELSVLENVTSLSDHELREALKEYGQSPGPITDSTRSLYRKKLATLIQELDSNSSSNNLNQSTQSKLQANNIDDDDDDDDTSDEDYNVQDEESEDDDDEDEEEEEEEEPIEAFEDEFVDDNLSSTTNDNLATSVSRVSFTNVGSDATPNRISRGILILLVSFFVAIFSFYLYSRNNYKLFVPSQLFKNITKQLLVLLALSPIGYLAYRILRYHRQRRHREMQIVAGLVNEVLELLQSPDNPKGMMPILHIRDTLITPAERNTEKMVSLWTKAVKFIEEHESRVKVELVNIDGEDFRAWKWIGSRRL